MSSKSKEEFYLGAMHDKRLYIILFNVESSTALKLNYNISFLRVLTNYYCIDMLAENRSVFRV